MTRKKFWRQGDVLVMTEPVPLGAVPVEREGGRVILAHGELTGHAHAFADPQVRQYKTADGRFYFEIEDQPAALRHEEHTAIALQPGMYRRVIQVEYTPQELRSVAD